MIRTRFFDNGGLVWIDLGADWPGFNDALNDGVSALSPRGQAPALSTFWIDHTLARLDEPPGTVVTGGNSTRIERTRSGVRAISDYEFFEDEEMSLDDFVRCLTGWRDEVTARQSAGDPARPEQGPYQRNPPD